MKGALKRMAKSDTVRVVLAWLAANYARLVLATGRMERHLPDDTLPYFRGEQPAIFALWHSRILLIQSHKPPRPMSALFSSHRDGRLIADALSHIGITAVHGSTSRGGAEALRALVRAWREGHNLAITPDGPRGPAEVCSEGVAQLALLTDAPVICVSYAASRRRRLRSWDRFVVPLPFSRVYFVAASPILPEAFRQHASVDARHNGREALRCAIEATLARITAQADAAICPKRSDNPSH